MTYQGDPPNVSEHIKLTIHSSLGKSVLEREAMGLIPREYEFESEEDERKRLQGVYEHLKRAKAALEPRRPGLGIWLMDWLLRRGR
jgi:hypothetical protein